MKSHGLKTQFSLLFVHDSSKPLCELRSEVAVVGEQEHAGCVAVEASYRVDALRAHVLHEVHHGLTLLRVVACCHAVLRFVR